MSILLPIYMYHQIAPESDPEFEPYLYQTPEALRRQIRQLRSWGFELVTLAEAWRRIAAGDSRRSAVLTFDDLYSNFHEFALPVIADEGVAATVFAIGASLAGGEVANILSGNMRAPAATELREISATGIEIGSHGFSHRVFTDLSDEDLRRELEDSRKAIEDVAGVAVSTVCYPRGRTSPRVEKMVEAAGYECACSTLRGNSHEAGERFRLARVRMHGERVGLKLRYTATRVYYWLNRSRREKDRLKFAAEDKF